MSSSSSPFPPYPADTSVTRQELHFRRIDMRGFSRSDGLYEVEGRVIDHKPHDFTPVSGGNPVPVGQPIHDMGVRLVIDVDMVIHDVQTFTLAAPYAVCPEGGRAPVAEGLAHGQWLEP